MRMQAYYRHTHRGRERDRQNHTQNSHTYVRTYAHMHTNTTAEPTLVRSVAVISMNMFLVFRWILVWSPKHT